LLTKKVVVLKKKKEKEKKPPDEDSKGESWYLAMVEIVDFDFQEAIAQSSSKYQAKKS
jgi:hypothetical protein